MKILQVITNLTSGGAEKLIYEIAPRMKEAGHQVDILVLFDKNNIYIEDLEKLGLKIKSLSYNSRFNPLNLIKLIRFIKKNKYDIVHTHLFPALYFSAIATFFYSKTKFFYTEHSTNNKRRKYKVFRFIEKIIYSRFDKIICISNKTEENLRNHIKCSSERILTIENGIDLEKFQNAFPIERKKIHESLKEKDILITMVGRFSPQKDQLTLIRAMKNLPLHYKLLLVGEGVLQEKCKKEVELLGLNNRVLFLGIRRDVANIFKSSNISVLSSIWEGFGLVAVEAMATGIPVIGTNVEGLKEVIKNDEYMFKLGASKELAEKILKIINFKNNKQQKEYLEENSKKYSINKMLKEYLKIYYY